MNPDDRYICDDCVLLPESCGHDIEDCEQKARDAEAEWADWMRKSRLEDGDA